MLATNSSDEFMFLLWKISSLAQFYLFVSKVMVLV